MARLLYTDQGGRQQAIDLDPGRPQTVIGRQADCEIVAYDTSVSRRHCIVVPEDGGYVVVDLGSANGTLVNDVRITRRRLAADDVIRCGAFAVRFVETAADSRENLADRYRRARGGVADPAMRAQIERLQAFNDNQSQRLLQLQEELTRSDGERGALMERLARVDAEGRLSRQRVAELEEHLRRLMGALDQREREVEALRAIPAPPPPPDAPLPVAPLTQSALAAENVALRAQVASLHGALAVDEAYERAARLVPTVDRWQALTVARAQLAVARDERASLEARVRELEAGVGRSVAATSGAGAEAVRRADAAAKAAEGRARAAESELREALARLREAERRVGELDARVRDAEGRAKAAEARASEAERPAPPRAFADGATRADRPKAGLLAGLGGLGETARVGQSGGGRGPLGARLARGDERDARIAELEAALRGADERRARAEVDADALVERLGRYRDDIAASGMAALQLAELVDLGRALRAGLREPEDG